MNYEVFWRSGLMAGVLWAFVSGCSDGAPPALDARSIDAPPVRDASAADVPVGNQPDTASPETGIDSAGDARLGSDGLGDGLARAEVGTDGPVLTADGPKSLCGNGIVDIAQGEQCDDGNTNPGDGCSETCKLDTWPPGPWWPVVICGDGKLGGSEQCDDGNVSSGDGCSASCQVEVGWRCPRVAVRCGPICGDNLIKGDETCDDGNLQDGDGCSAYCRIESGDGGVDGDAGNVPRCGDGVLNGPEECDLGDGSNRSQYGGCTADCRRAPYCGDGVVNGPEECDLGAKNGQTSGKGSCTSDCHNGAYCGDGRLQTYLGEDCDLGDLNGVRTDRNRNPTTDPSGYMICSADCRLVTSL
jgi:cysteine-rich repeat protein